MNIISYFFKNFFLFLENLNQILTYYYRCIDEYFKDDEVADFQVNQKESLYSVISVISTRYSRGVIFSTRRRATKANERRKPATTTNEYCMRMYMFRTQ